MIRNKFNHIAPKLRKTIFFVINFVLISSSFAQKEVLRLDNVGSKDGLSSDWVNSVTEDDRGFLWVGTRHGLSVFDGENSLIFTNDPKDKTSISGNDISYVIKSRSEQIVLGTWGAGVNLIDPLSKTVTRPKEVGGSAFFNIKCLAEDNDTIIWVGTYGNGIYRYDQRIDSLQKCELALEGSITDRTLFQYCETMTFHNDTIWLASRIGGLAYIDPVSSKIHKYHHSNYDQSVVYQVSSLNSDGNSLLIGTVFGMYHELKTEKGEILLTRKVSRDSNTNVRVTSILPVADGSIWISTNQGIQRKDQDGELVFFVGPKNVGDYGDVFCSFYDSRGIVWFGNWGSGLGKYYAKSSNFEEVNLNEFNASHVNCLLEVNDSTMYVGSTKGVLVLDQKSHSIKRLLLSGDYKEELARANILGVVSYEDDLVLLVDGLGLFKVDSVGVITKLDKLDDEIRNSTFITSVTGLPNGELWIATWSQGAYVYNMNTDIGKHYSVGESESLLLDSKLVYTVYLDRDSVLWLGTKEGVSYFDKQQNSFIPIVVSFSNSENKNRVIKDVKSIVQDDEGVYWFAAAEGLVSYSRSNREAKLFGFADGLLDVSLNGLIFIKEDLWGISKSGLMRLNTKTLDLKNYTSEDGLLPNSFNSSLKSASNGLVYICNGDGIEVFDPEKIIEFDMKSDVFFERFYIDDVLATDSVMNKKHISQVSELYLDYDQNNLSFYLSVLDYTNRNDKIFAHKLEGFNSKWKLHDAQYSRIRYTNLNPGKYELYLSELNSDESINESKIQKITIYIASPFWETWWFRLLLFLIVGLAVFAFLSYRTRAIKARNSELEKYAHERTVEIKSKNVKLNKAFKELAEKDKALGSNLSYASLLQNALQPKADEISEVFKNQFVMYQPKDVVSGDFYWSTNIGDKSIFVVADCTGHGVSGAFISVLGVTFTRFIVKALGITRPDLILNYLHKEVSEAFHQSTSKMSDGMDMSVISYDRNAKSLDIAGALSSLIIVEDGKLPRRIKGDRFPVGGGGLYKSRKAFSLTSIQLSNRTMVYQFTDGFQDQFGEVSGKKFMQKRFRDLLISNSSSSISTQQAVLEKTFLDWKGNEKQVDDVLVVGLEIKP